VKTKANNRSAQDEFVAEVPVIISTILLVGCRVRVPVPVPRTMNRKMPMMTLPKKNKSGIIMCVDRLQKRS
jgi:hypothetical protein